MEGRVASGTASGSPGRETAAGPAWPGICRDSDIRTGSSGTYVSAP